MKKIKVITRVVHENLFNADIVLIVCPYDYFLEAGLKVVSKDKQEDFRKMVTEHGNDSWGLATQFPFGGGGSIIWANPKSNTGTLVHEITHAAHHLLKCRSIPLSSDTEEVYAY